MSIKLAVPCMLLLSAMAGQASAAEPTPADAPDGAIRLVGFPQAIQAPGEQRRHRFAEGPGELAVGGCLAVIDLRAFGMDAEHDRLAGGGDGVGERLRGCGGSGHGREQQAEDGELGDGHGWPPRNGVKMNGPRPGAAHNDV